MPNKATKDVTPSQESSVYPLKYDVKIHSIRPEGSLRATASVNINDAFAIRSVKVMEGSKGLFVSMPSYKSGNGEYKDICFPCTKDAKQAFDNAVIQAYQQALTQGQSTSHPTQAPENHSVQQSQPVMGGM